MSLSGASFEYVQRLLHRRAAIELESNKAYLVQSRLLPVVKRYGLETVDQLVAELQRFQTGAMIDDVIDAMTTNETFFFRDTSPFTALREEVLPQLFRRRELQRRLTIWSAACSTGQEPYSVAMLLSEHFSEYLDWDIRLLGTDLSRSSLRQAGAGCYNELEMSRGLTPHLRQKKKKKCAYGAESASWIRSMVRPPPLKPAVQWPDLPRIDVVLLRNVMVYLDTATKKLILRRMRKQIWRDGYLFLGGAETTLHLDDAFRRVVMEDFSFFQLREHGRDLDSQSFVS